VREGEPGRTRGLRKGTEVGRWCDTLIIDGEERGCIEKGGWSYLYLGYYGRKKGRRLQETSLLKGDVQSGGRVHHLIIGKD